MNHQVHMLKVIQDHSSSFKVIQKIVLIQIVNIKFWVISHESFQKMNFICIVVFMMTQDQKYEKSHCIGSFTWVSKIFKNFWTRQSLTSVSSRCSVLEQNFPCLNENKHTNTKLFHLRKSKNWKTGFLNNNPIREKES